MRKFKVLHVIFIAIVGVLYFGCYDSDTVEQSQSELPALDRPAEIQQPPTYNPDSFRVVELAQFEGFVDPLNNEFTILWTDPAIQELGSKATERQALQGGAWGACPAPESSGLPDWVHEEIIELYTIPGSVGRNGDCGPNPAYENLYDVYCGTVSVRWLGLGSEAFPNIYVEIEQVVPSSHAAIHDTPDWGEGGPFSSVLGLFFYGDIPAGGNSSVTWVFQTPNQDAFYFGGRAVSVMQEVCDDDTDSDCNGNNDNGCYECGNNILEQGEQCDDGNTTNDDGCEDDCKLKDSTCGDGTVDSNEDCDPEASNASEDCTSGCTFRSNTCGNSQVDLNNWEECDSSDSDDPNRDDCVDCMIELCGNGVVNPGEECDGNLNYENGELYFRCNSDCTVNFCGNGLINADEECDDGNSDPCDACDNDCNLTSVSCMNPCFMDCGRFEADCGFFPPDPDPDSIGYFQGPVGDGLQECYDLCFDLLPEEEGGNNSYDAWSPLVDCIGQVPCDIEAARVCSEEVI